MRHLTDLHNVHSSSLTALFAHSTLEPKQVEVPGPKVKPKKGNSISTGTNSYPIQVLRYHESPASFIQLKLFILERDIIGIDHRNNNQLCFFKSEADLEDGFISLNRKILYEHPKVTMYNNLLDAHLYIVEKWVCDFIKAEE